MLAVGATKKSEKLSPILKWAGGKEQELKHILPAAPASIQNYYEPFVGGGAVYTAITADKYYINDRSEELIDLYKNIASGKHSDFFEVTNRLIAAWEQLSELVKANEAYLKEVYKAYSANRTTEEAASAVLVRFITDNAAAFGNIFTGILDMHHANFRQELEVNLLRKVKRMKRLEAQKHPLPDNDIGDNLETAFKSAFYMHVRHLYNVSDTLNLSNSTASALFFFIRNYAYSGMFRYNASGAFNVPYGGIGYNSKQLQKKVHYLQSPALQQRLRNTKIANLDFEQFLKKHRPSASDFVFADPPYDTEFSTYAGNEFSREDQQRLARYLTEKCPAKWMLVIKNTGFVYNLYANKGLQIRTFDKKYLVSFMNRNDKSAEHLMITNY